MKTIKILLFVMMIITISSCSKSDNSSSSSCNEIVCGGFTGGPSGAGTYTIYRGTLNPDTCGSIELQVNATTFNYYKAKWSANPKGYCCWEGLKN